jgi:hypothetical protein
MDERELREWVERVRRSALSRRAFVQDPHFAADL